MSFSTSKLTEPDRRIAVTGATGFIGRGVVGAIEAAPDIAPVCCVRKIDPVPTRSVTKTHIVGDIGPATDWVDALEGCDVVVHAAGRAHVGHEDRKNSGTTFHSVNVEGTRRLAEQAAECGIRRVVFISSIGVHGNETHEDSWRETSPLQPETEYARSKQEAEAALQEVASRSGLDVVIIRPPLVYGPGDVPGNFGRLVNIVRKGAPLPFASIGNSRSFIARDNLVDLILTCLDHPAAANETFLASDDDDQSTGDLVRAIADGLGCSPRLWPLPPALLARSLEVIGRGNMARQLCGSLQLDVSKVKAHLGWKPPTGFHGAMRKAMQSS